VTDLRPKDGKDALGVDEAGVAKVVKASRGEDLRTSLEPDRLAYGGQGGTSDRMSGMRWAKHPPRKSHCFSLAAQQVRSGVWQNLEWSRMNMDIKDKELHLLQRRSEIIDGDNYS
jgi:hypothetical protein